MRQIDTYERELGWVFLTYKLSDSAEQHPSAVYWSFRKAVDNGLIELSPHDDACLHFPAADYALGDNTLAPTAEPPTWHEDYSSSTSRPTLIPGTAISVIKDSKSFLFGLFVAVLLFGLYVITGWCSSPRYAYTALADRDLRV